MRERSLLGLGSILQAIKINCWGVQFHNLGWRPTAAENEENKNINGIFIFIFLRQQQKTLPGSLFSFIFSASFTSFANKYEFMTFVTQRRLLAWCENE
jgi:hypothetical protein